MRNERTSKRVANLSATALKYFGNKRIFDGDNVIFVGTRQGSKRNTIWTSYRENTPFTVADILAICASATTQTADKKVKLIKKHKPERPKGSKNKVKRGKR